jgi:predicted nuclease of predicted toxin-antitoxin system
VRILLDEQLPRQLARYFVGHDVRTTQEQGWAGLKNGALLAQAREASFEVFVTGDKNLEFQQNLRSSGLFVVVLVAPTNKLEDLLPRLAGALQAIARAIPGGVERVEA